MTAPDYTGLRFDRADIEDTTPAEVPAGVDGWAVTGRLSGESIPVPDKPCCGAVRINEECDCAEIAEQLRRAPVIVMRPFNLRRLAAEHVTAAEVDRRERGAA
ncbi:hypothetical protein TPA0907_55460 [Micromonospora humidisoli]|uniref:hypothetical protein n=1 Tax=Micromonospora sp. AKA109 TaxID=2733865 RepID=UPI0022C390B0|nr:hypothetical protein [Micromonospora sp. AKA109]GHJ11179.1 hypothetical protein TPA0907_55460 [Micromonospora sp. AKA109]